MKDELHEDEDEEYLKQMQGVPKKSETVSKKKKKEVKEFRERITHEKEIRGLDKNGSLRMRR